MKNIRPLIRLAALSVAAVAAGLFAQTGAPRELTLIVGRGELVQFSNDIKTVAASEPKIADVSVVSPREVMINARGLGKSTVIVWETGAAPRRYNISVLADTMDFDAVKRSITEAMAGGPVAVTGNADTIVLSGKAESVAAAKKAEAIASTYGKKVVNLIETPAPAELRQVMLEVKFAAIDRIALQEVGFNFLSRNPNTLGALSSQQFSTPRFSQLQFQNQEFSNTTLNFADLLNMFIFRPDLNIGATIRALQSRNLLQMLAEPNLIALEGREASFLAGGEFPFPTLTATSTGGATAPVVTVQFKKFGVQLDFKPEITSDNRIHLKLRPQVSSLDYANAVTLQGFLIPAVATRFAETEAILNDGESFAVAGLIDNRVIQSMSRVKWLGDVPVVGQLFRSRSTRKTNEELLVVITPRFVKPLTPDQKPKLPDWVEDFLPPTPEDKGAGSKKLTKQQKNAAKPEFIGPRGHQEPK
ncbi:MAG: pilus assembly protein N-terminal domain-containing protein [Bryobacterales bacterium]|nr:pilus assembly protein N-terminal domain-containing protein [Bryobacterales bacterium]